MDSQLQISPDSLKMSDIFNFDFLFVSFSKLINVVNNDNYPNENDNQLIIK